MVFLAEVDRAFKQFVFECMDLSTTDENGHIMFRQHKQRDVPWDDPYPHYKVLTLSPGLTGIHVVSRLFTKWFISIVFLTMCARNEILLLQPYSMIQCTCDYIIHRA